MEQYDPYWKDMKDRIEETEYTHLYKVHDMLAIEETGVVAGLLHRHDGERWSKLRVIWRKQKANWFRMYWNKKYNPDDARRNIGMRRTAKNEVIDEMHDKMSRELEELRQSAKRLNREESMMRTLHQKG